MLLFFTRPTLPAGEQGNLVIVDPGYSDPSPLFLSLPGIQILILLDVIHLRPLLRWLISHTPLLQGSVSILDENIGSSLCGLTAPSRSVHYHVTATSISMFGDIF